MLQFISSLPGFDDDAAKLLCDRIRGKFNDKEGVCYYKYPVLGSATGVMADLTLFTKSDQPVAIRCLPYQIGEIKFVQEDYWIINDQKKDSPIWELDDFVAALDSLVKIDRRLRRRLRPKGILALPLISKPEFEEKHDKLPSDFDIVWRGDEIDKIISPLDRILCDEEWLSFRAVIQTATPLRGSSGELIQGKADTLSKAIRELDRQIKTLDLEQEKVAMQIPPGPQRIRGLAGTGKTVLLAMKAANIHRHFPDSRILFTFYTQSLYNQIERLIKQFYGVHRSNTEPDWNKIHIRHAWGGRNRAGVYSDICGKRGVEPLSLNKAKMRNFTIPFQACCEHALSLEIEADYDYVIVDEAQDFPREFFRVLYELSKNPHCIYWAYDELQSLTTSNLAMPGPEDLFGKDSGGNPLIVLDDQNYPGDIQKDFVLNKSYRCPQKVLMLAHAIGLGLYNPKGGCVQMLESRDSWSAIGYEIEGNAEWRTGEWRNGDRVTLRRPKENSPNRIGEIYKGHQKLITAKVFQTRDEEFDWVASSIGKDVNEEDVAPEHIAVIILGRRNKEFSAQIQGKLIQHSVASIIPGAIHDADSYAEEGRITISNVFRAKGNEAYIVYVVGFEELYNYVDAIDNRNRAFTAISRSKAWVRITGIGAGMRNAKNEINTILSDVPRFRFTFPDMQKIRNLDAVTRKRRRERSEGDRKIRELIRKPELLKAANPELFEDLKELILRQDNEN